MKHNYKVTGMSCAGCKTSVEGALGNLKEVKEVSVDLKNEEVSIEMASHLELNQLQGALTKAGLHYTIEMPGSHSHQDHAPPSSKNLPKQTGNGVYYCPMHCEGEKTYQING